MQRIEKKLVPIVDTIKLCRRLGLPLHGHHDDSKYHPDVGSYSQGSAGNFIKLFHFRVRAGDTVLEEHLKKCPKNASSLNYCDVKEVKEGKFFSVIADEAADCSNKEQMSIVLSWAYQGLNLQLFC